MASGKESPQYKILQQNFEHIVATLMCNTAAHHVLRLNVKSKGWLEVYEKPTAEVLISIILNCIKQNASDYSVFMDMLYDTDGMDQIAEKLQLPGRTISLYILL